MASLRYVVDGILMVFKSKDWVKGRSIFSSIANSEQADSDVDCERNIDEFGFGEFRGVDLILDLHLDLGFDFFGVFFDFNLKDLEYFFWVDLALALDGLF